MRCVANVLVHLVMLEIQSYVHYNMKRRPTTSILTGIMSSFLMRGVCSVCKYTTFKRSFITRCLFSDNDYGKYTFVAFICFIFPY